MVQSLGFGVILGPPSKEDYGSRTRRIVRKQRKAIALRTSGVQVGGGLEAFDFQGCGATGCRIQVHKALRFQAYHVGCAACKHFILEQQRTWKSSPALRMYLPTNLIMIFAPL